MKLCLDVLCDVCIWSCVWMFYVMFVYEVVCGCFMWCLYMKLCEDVLCDVCIWSCRGSVDSGLRRVCGVCAVDSSSSCSVCVACVSRCTLDYYKARKILDMQYFIYVIKPKYTIFARETNVILWLNKLSIAAIKMGFFLYWNHWNVYCIFV